MFYTKEEIKIILRKLGLRSGMNIVMDIGDECNFILGAEKALLEAVIEIIGYDATLLIPSFTTFLAYPVSKNKMLEYEILQKLEYSHLPFDIKKTLPELKVATQLLVYEDAIRSNHPLYSFLAWGKYAQSVINQHPLHFALSKSSPLGKMMELNAYYLSLNTINKVLFQFAQSMLKTQNITTQIVTIIHKNQRVNKALLEYEFNDKKYDAIQTILENENLILKQKLGENVFKLCSIKKTYPLIQMLLSK